MSSCYSLRVFRALSGLALVAGLATHAEPPGFHLAARHDIPGSGDTGALQLDVAAQRLYAARGDTITVVDANSGIAVGAISVGAAVRGLALAPEAQRGIASTASNSAVLFDLQSGSVVKTVPLPGEGADAVAYDADTRHVFVAQRDSGDVVVLDPDSGAVVADLHLGGKLGGMACDGFARMFVTAQDLNLVHVVDTHALSSLGDYPTAPGTGPTGLALEDEGRRLFVPCLNGKLVVIDNDVGPVFRILRLAGKGPACVAFGLADPDAPVGDPPWKGRLLAVTADGTANVGKMLAFVNYAAHDHFPLGAAPLGVAMDGPKQRGYVLLAKSSSASELVVLDPFTASATP